MPTPNCCGRPATQLRRSAAAARCAQTANSASSATSSDPGWGSGGKCVLSDAELQRVAQRRGNFVAYELEVCPDCGWNHLIRRYPIGAG